MKAKIFVGPRDTGKTRVAEMIADHVGRDNTLVYFGKTIMKGDPFKFKEVNEDTKLIIFDDCPADFNYREFYHVTGGDYYGAPLKFTIKSQIPALPVRFYNVPQLIFITDELDEDFANSGASFNERFEVVRFPLEKRRIR